MAEKLQEYSLTWEVSDEMTAKRIGSAGSQILSTPNMVALMEAAALELAKSYLEEGQTTVGAEIHCRHLAPTPVGMKVTATAKLRSIESRKMWFDIEVNDDNLLIGDYDTKKAYEETLKFLKRRKDITAIFAISAALTLFLTIISSKS